MKKVFLTLFVLLHSLLNFAQQSKADEVLFTIDGKPFYKNEFVRVYNKNLNLVKDDSQKDLNNYLDLYIGYKLKVEKAKKLGLQNETNYQNELKSYRTQLAKNYVNDSKVTQELVQEAYDRSLKEVKASHILILVDQNAAPNDTLTAYNKILKIRNRINAGEDFQALAMELSEDPSAKSNKGDLGYFSVFKMVYPFENAAYKTQVGKVSGVFRTRFGYHILKVTDKRDNRGEVQVKHLMLLNPKDKNTEEEEKVKEKINEIYQKITQGESFEELAKQFSEDKSTASKGGTLQRFGSGQLTSQEFEDAAFSLKKADDISKPFQSQFGWHIVKLVEKYEVKPFEDVKFELENKIKNDSRSVIITNSLTNKLKSKYTVDKNEKQYQTIVKSVNDNFYKNEWKQPEDLKPFGSTLLTINKNKKVDGKTFLSYLESQQKANLKITPIQKLVDEVYQGWVNTQLINYYDDNLETEFPEFSYVMDEYRDGLLLFDLMEKEIWEKSKTDSIGLENFYQSNKNNYMWKKRFDIDIYSSTQKSIIEKTQKFLKKGKNADYIKGELNANGKINVVEKNGVFEEDYEGLAELNITQTGITNITQKGDYYFIAKVKEIIPAKTKTIDECKGKLSSDYQQYLEENWVKSLKNEFNVSINDATFQKVKKEIQP